MAAIYYVNDVPVFEDEVKEKLYSGELFLFDKAVNSGDEMNINFENGSINSNELGSIDFTPIGIGKPLSIEILTIYSGDAPERFLGKKDMLVTTGVKSIGTYDSAPKAINQIVRKVNDNQYYEPSAFNEGSPIVYYTPALDMNTILCSFHLVADTFNESIFEDVSSLLAKAGGIPVFAPAASVLLAGSTLASIASKLGKAIFESKPFFKGDFNIRLDTPGQIPTKAKYVLITDNKFEKEFINYKPGNIVIDDSNHTKVRLVHKTTNKEYSGDAPYILISLDGREREDLKNFKPTHASAAIMEQFYGTETNSQSIEVVQDALMLYNDFHYFEKAKKQKEKLEGLAEDSEAYKSIKLLYDAYVKNINSDIFTNNI
ncbi:hypothetical protein ACQY1Q_07585 [Tenacibaculum sp. TC6]|uniref:hypothetical protein n=1 Tax=Tenacibaculum sp. TC6 TaxID=3423223 RepID=UPI003D36DBAC